MPGIAGRRLYLGFGGLYLALVAGLAVYHLSVNAPNAPAIAQRIVPTDDPRQDPRCVRVLDLAQQGGIVLDRGDPDRLVVSKSLWAQVPEKVADALVSCHVGSRASGTASHVVKR